MIPIGNKLLKFGRFENGPTNSIVDVPGVQVGHNSLNFGEGPLRPGQGPARTGVSVVLPCDGIWKKKLFAGSFVMNGNGEACGLMWLQESGILETPIAFTNTLSVGAVQSSVVEWMLEKYSEMGINDDVITPVVLECDDSILNDIRGMHIKKEHVFTALAQASTRPPVEGAVGAGMGMIAYELKGGIGTSSRKVSIGSDDFTVAVFLNSNHGKRHTLNILGKPIGQHLSVPKPSRYKDGSVAILVATDAPLDSRQLNRLCKRAFLGISRTGGISYHSSGDIVVAFSTANEVVHRPEKVIQNFHFLSDFYVDDLFEAASDACEEAMIKALVNAKTVRGRDGFTAFSLMEEATQIEKLL
jgi:D-aminopeptidase